MINGEDESKSKVDQGLVSGDSLKKNQLGFQKTSKAQLFAPEIESPMISMSGGDMNDDMEFHKREPKPQNEDQMDEKIVEKIENSELPPAEMFPHLPLVGPAIEQVTGYEWARLDPVIPLECWQETRDHAVPFLISKEYCRFHISKKIEPLILQLEIWEEYSITNLIHYEERFVIEPAQERVAYGYFDYSFFDNSLRQVKLIKSKKEHEKGLMRELKNENLKYMQILIDKNGREYLIDNDDNYDDDDDSEKDIIHVKRKGKGSIVQRMKQREGTGRVNYTY